MPSAASVRQSQSLSASEDRTSRPPCLASARFLDVTDLLLLHSGDCNCGCKRENVAFASLNFKVKLSIVLRL